MKTFSDFETFMLSQAVPSLNLPALVDPTEVDLHERASIVNYGDPLFCERSESNLKSLYMLLGVLPSTAAERFACIGQRSI